MEESKYYQPDIKEFRVGFEYERASYGGKLLPGSPVVKEWIKSTLEADLYDLNDILDIYNEGQQCTDLRVKLLDSKDIESFGFEFQDEVHDVKRYFYYGESDIYQLTCAGTHTRILIKGITNEKNISIFRGHIKNKSELKVLLNQLGIL